MCEEEANKLAREAGMDECVTKPFNRVLLASALRRWTVTSTTT
jgi:CheY-like chemotaxis protein